MSDEPQTNLLWMAPRLQSFRLALGASPSCADGDQGETTTNRLLASFITACVLLNVIVDISLAREKWRCSKGRAALSVCISLVLLAGVFAILAYFWALCDLLKGCFYCVPFVVLVVILQGLTSPLPCEA